MRLLCSIRLLIGSDLRALSQVCFTKYGAMSLKGKVPPPLPPRRWSEG
jgi:hypothetical protein